MSVLLERRGDGTLAFFIDGDLQFDSRDEHIYHECLALPAVALAELRKHDGKGLRALIIGGGDGLTARELLKSDQITHIDLVDYDKEVLAFARKDWAFLNRSSLDDYRVRVHVQDAWDFADQAIESGITYDVIVSDLTVPQKASETRIHSVEWYAKLKNLLTAQGVLAVNAASPSATPSAYWSILNSILTTGLSCSPYRIVMPSFSELGYGHDWGFALASSVAITPAEIERKLMLPKPRRALKDTEHLRKLFHFSQQMSTFQSNSKPASERSDILLHYLFNGEKLTDFSGPVWDALSVDLLSLLLPEIDNSSNLLSPEIRYALTVNGGEPMNAELQVDALYERVVGLVPALQRFQTRSMINDFLTQPVRFLDSIDLSGLVERLLQRAAELPKQLVAELVYLKDRLIEWTGDYSSLLNVGARVLTIVTLVVIIGNLIYPDTAYGKGGHGGGGDHGGHADGGRGDHAGDRGFGNRGFHGDRDFGHHFDNYGHWGHRWGGAWGGWARPGWGWGGWGWGGWGVPVYAGGPGFLNVNVGGNSGQAVDEEGSQYPARNYNYHNTYVNNYSYGSDNQQEPTGDQTAQSAQADYRLGDDADILPDGRVAVRLTDQSYLLVSGDGTQVVDQASGMPMVSLATDPYMAYHIASEIRRQSLGLQSAGQAKQAASGMGNQLGFNDQDQSDANTEVGNIQDSVGLLNKAAQNFAPPDAPPSPVQPPVAGAMELFNSAWMTPDGNYLALKRADGSIVYMDGQGWYSDQGQTRLRAPYPQKFKAVVVSYLNTLVKESDATKNSLLQDQAEGQSRLQMLNDRLSQMSTGSGSFAVNGQQFDQGESTRRLNNAIKRTQKRLDGINNQLTQMPIEVVAANKLLARMQGG